MSGAQALTRGEMRAGSADVAAAAAVVVVTTPEVLCFRGGGGGGGGYVAAARVKLNSAIAAAASAAVLLLLPPTPLLLMMMWLYEINQSIEKPLLSWVEVAAHDDARERKRVQNLTPSVGGAASERSRGG